MNLIKKLTGIILIILYTLRIKKKPKVDNTDLNQLLQTAIDTKPKDEDQALIDSVIKDYKDKSQDQSGEYLLRVEEKKEQSETDYLLSSEANKKRLLESVENIKAKVEDRQEKIETKVEEIKGKFDQQKCADVIAKVAEKVFNESPTKMTGFQSIGVDRKKREVDSLKEKQSKGKKLNRKERNKINLYNKHNGASQSNDTAIQQQNMINNVILISTLDDDTTISTKVDDVKLPTASEPFTGSGGSFSGGGASGSWSDDTHSKQSKPEPQSPSYSTPSYSHSRNDDYEYTPTKSYSSSSSSSRSDDSSSHSSSYDSGSSYSSSDSSSSSSSSSDW